MRVKITSASQFLFNNPPERVEWSSEFLQRPNLKMIMGLRYMDNKSGMQISDNSIITANVA